MFSFSESVFCMLICVHGIAEKMEYKRTEIKNKKGISIYTDILVC